MKRIASRPLAYAGLLAAALVVAFFAFRPLAERFSGVLPAPVELETAAPTPADFAGAESCRDCHAGQYELWRASTHGRAGGPPSTSTVIAPFDGAPIRFANALVAPRIRGGAYEFVVEPDAERERILRVDGVVGGGHMYGGGTQAFVTRWSDGTWRMLPFEWSRQARTWFCNTNSRTGKGWTPIDAGLRIEECGDWPPIRVLGDHPRFANCQSCHASQAVVRYDSASRRLETSIASLAINCEACHGPASRHVELARAGRLGASDDIGLPSLATLDKDASIGVCYQCHAVKDQVRPGFVSGAPLSAYYSTKLPMLGERPLFPDGRIRTFAYQEGHQYSDCYLNGGMTCVSCHDPHSQGYRSATGEPLTGRFDDRQCTSCHVSKADRVREHTGHPLSVTCVSCHMPARQEPETRALDPRRAASRVVPYARSDHTISIPRPRLDSALGLASACAACHAGMSTAAQEQRIREWWERVKPPAPIIAAQLDLPAGMPERDAGRLLLGATDSSGYTFPRFSGIARFLERYAIVDRELPAEVAARLRELAGSSDVDIQAAALATLHLAQGGDGGTRRVLARALREAGGRDAALRSRWAIILGFVADGYASTGNFAHASAAYERAIAVQPGSARLWLSLGNAHRGAGEHARAVAAYQRSIALDPRAPLAWVNLGIAELEGGRIDSAAAALTRATEVDANEPLGWFNLANVMLLRRDVARAVQMYERAVAIDPSLAAAEFQLARVRLLAGDSTAAMRHLRRGLAYDTADAQTRAFAAALERRLAPPARRMP